MFKVEEAYLMFAFRQIASLRYRYMHRRGFSANYYR